MSRLETIDNSLQKANSTESSESGPLPYAAVPLDLNTRSSLERLAYHNESLSRIQNGLVRAVKNAEEYGWTPSNAGLARKIQSLIDVSLTQSHETRLFLNRRFDRVLDNVDDPRITRAADGTALPKDLLSVLIDYPQLDSIELAKLSHPLDFAASQPMDSDVYRVVNELGNNKLDPPKHKAKTIDLGIPAMTLLRKQKIGRVATTTGEIAIVSRQAFLVRGDEDAEDAMPFIDRRIKNNNRFSELVELLEEHLPPSEGQEHMKWLQPIASSYFATYLSPEGKLEK